MASPEIAPLRNGNKYSPWLAIFIPIVLTLCGYAVGSIQKGSAQEERIKTIEANYVSKDKYDATIAALKETLNDIKEDVKEIKKEVKK